MSPPRQFQLCRIVPATLEGPKPDTLIILELQEHDDAPVWTLTFSRPEQVKDFLETLVATLNEQWPGTLPRAGGVH